MERTTGSETKSKIVVFIKEWSTTVIPFANYIMSQLAESPSRAVAGYRLLVLRLKRRRLRAVALCALENQGDRLVLQPYDADHHGAIRGKGVAFESNRTRFAGCTRP
jgi:hypothetical protein